MRFYAPLLGLASIVLSLSTARAQTGPVAKSIDWSQPPLACIEDIMPHQADRPCPDLSRVPEITKEIKLFSSEEERSFWTDPKNKKGLNYCRSLEILRREKETPGSMTAGSLQISWMRITAVQNSADKLAAILNATTKYQIPAFVLMGALTQESLFSDLGISDDGGNFSCGVGQINIVEWCRWAEGQSTATKNLIGWPSQVACEKLATEWVRPFQELALKNLKEIPEYRLSAEQFKNITFDDVKDKIGGSSNVEKQKNFSVIKSFIDNCGQPLYGIDAKAHELSRLFKNHVPESLKNRETYASGKSLEQNCKYHDQSKYYPLHTGWLLAVAAYNAGPRSTEVFPYYYGLNQSDFENPAKVAFVDPTHLVEGLFFGGKFNTSTGRIEYTSLGGASASNLAFKQCVMHQHVVRIVQHVTKSNEAPLLMTLNEVEGCKKDKPLPESRMQSPGRQSF